MSVAAPEVELDLEALRNLALGSLDQTTLQMVAQQLKGESDEVVGYHHSTTHSSYSTHGTLWWTPT